MKLVRRSEWRARPPRSVVKGTLNRPTTGHWNGPTVYVKGRTTWDHVYCAGLVRGIQNFHMDSRGWSDIAYNYLECPHGYTFEGRGLNTWNGANGTNTGNRTSHAICFLAGQNNSFLETEKVGFKEAVLWIARNSKAPNSAIGHRDHKSTECPGNARYNWIRSGMPVSGVFKEPEPEPSPDEPEPIPQEEYDMQLPAKIVKAPDSPHWWVTDGITRQHVPNRTYAALLINQGAASAQAGTGDMSKTADIVPFTWPGDALNPIRIVGNTP